MDLHAAARGPDEALDDYRVLVPLVLDEERMPGAIDELADPLAAEFRAPDEVRVAAGSECLSVPVGLEALDDFSHLVSMPRDDRIVARNRQVPRRPIERLDERCFIVHHHRLLVREIERGIGVLHLDARAFERLVRRLVVLLAAAAGAIEHHAYLNAAMLGADDSLQEHRCGEDEHLDPDRRRRGGDRRDDRLRRVVWKHNQRARHVVLKGCRRPDLTGNSRL